MNLQRNVSANTPEVAIEIVDGCLTIGEQTFPDNCISLSPEDTQTLLDTLLISAQGLTPDLDDED